jgi:ArsR family transcriptional regulator
MNRPVKEMPVGEDEAVAALAALGNPTRLRLFRLLVRAGREGLNVGDMQRLMDTPASTLAHHLGMLARAGLVTQRRRGREVVSAADYDAVRALTDFLTAECCIGVPVEAPDLPPALPTSPKEPVT